VKEFVERRKKEEKEDEVTDFIGPVDATYGIWI
jgi:hypothetical protein